MSKALRASDGKINPALPKNVRNLITGKLGYERRGLEMRLSDTKLAGYKQLNEKMLASIKANHKGRAFTSDPQDAYTEITTNVRAITNEWPDIVWNTIESTLIKARITALNSSELNAIVDEFSWAIDQPPFTLNSINTEQYKNSVRIKAGSFGGLRDTEAIMGGIGSGRRWHFGAKDTTGDYRALDVRRWKRDGLPTPGQAFGWQWSRQGEVVASIRVRTKEGRVLLTYRHRNRGEEEWQDESYPVYLDWTPCHLGGERPWFLCPARGCGRRVALLYGGGIFACRHCHQLAYDSQRETPDDRAARRADKIRDKLEWEPGILNGKGWKPKGMHWDTYERLTAKHDAFVAVSLAGMARRLNLLGKSIEKTGYKTFCGPFLPPPWLYTGNSSPNFPVDGTRYRGFRYLVFLLVGVIF